MVKKNREKKRAAMELSIGTIVILVIAMTMLILGIIFVRSIMCSGIIITDKITKGVENEIIGLFGSREHGVKCMGEGGHEIRIGDGGRRQIACVINSNAQTNYKLTVKKVESLNKNVPTKTIEKWVLDQNWEGEVSPGYKTVPVVVLDVPEKVSDTSLKIEVEEENLNTGVKDTHIMYIDIVHIGALSSAIC